MQMSNNEIFIVDPAKLAEQALQETELAKIAAELRELMEGETLGLLRDPEAGGDIPTDSGNTVGGEITKVIGQVMNIIETVDKAKKVIDEVMVIANGGGGTAEISQTVMKGVADIVGVVSPATGDTVDAINGLVNIDWNDTDNLLENLNDNVTESGMSAALQWGGIPKPIADTVGKLTHEMMDAGVEGEKRAELFVDGYADYWKGGNGPDSSAGAFVGGMTGGIVELFDFANVIDGYKVADFAGKGVDYAINGLDTAGKLAKNAWDGIRSGWRFAAI